MLWPTELTLCSPLRQGEKRIESLLGLCLDFEEKGFRAEPPSMSSTAQAQAWPAGELSALCSVVTGTKGQAGQLGHGLLKIGEGVKKN
jgi:hypothetical protein